jgi:uncharacterized membrane protein
VEIQKNIYAILREFIEHVLPLLIGTLHFVAFILVCVMPIRTIYRGLFVLEAV